MKNKFDLSNIFYGWYIVAAGFIIMASGWGIVYNSASLFLKPISADLGFTRSQISVTLTISAIVQLIISLFAGRIFSRFNIKRLMQLSSIVLFISFFAHSLATSLITFYILSVIKSAAMSLLGILPLSLIISSWFYERRGFAIGIAFMGSGIGGMIFNSLAGLWIVIYGWQITFQILAVIMLLTIAPCTFFIIHIRPQDIGLFPLGKPVNNLVEKSEEKLEGLMLSEASKTLRFWNLVISLLIINVCMNSLLIFVAPHLSDIGYSLRFSANIAAISMGSLAIGKLVLGHFFDKFGILITTTIACLATTCGLLALILARYSLALIAIIICLGLGVAFVTIANPIITHKLFGFKDYSSINGILAAAASGGSVISPIMSGYFYDKTNSYNIYFMILVILSLIVTLLFYFTLSNGKQYEIE